MRLSFVGMLTVLILGAGGQSESIEGVQHDGAGKCNYTDVTTGATFDLT
jgi:hypothetical protein